MFANELIAFADAEYARELEKAVLWRKSGRAGEHLTRECEERAMKFRRISEWLTEAMWREAQS